jgi:acetyltransferase-like isoleucine patch superfamily enzyme
MNPKGYISASATIYHSDLRLGANIFMDDRVVIFQRKNGGRVELGDRVYIYRDTILETGHGGYLTIGPNSSIHPRCQLNAYVAPIQIGCGVMIAPNCAFYPYDHGLAPDRPIIKQPLQTKGSITVGDDAWLGFGVIVLGGVRIGNGAVVGAGSVVTSDVPDGGIAVGVPARVVKMRSDLSQRNLETP